jgi:hypothetical protein
MRKFSQSKSNFFTANRLAVKKQKLPKEKPFGSLAICSMQTHDFAPPPRDGFAFSSLQICNVSSSIL